MLGTRGGEGRVVIGKGVGQRGGQAAIMMCGCDGGWNGGDASLKSVFEWIWAINHFDQIFGRKFRLQVSKVYGGGEPPWSTAVGRPPWFMLTMLARGGELSYRFLC